MQDREPDPLFIPKIVGCATPLAIFSFFSDHTTRPTYTIFASFDWILLAFLSCLGSFDPVFVDFLCLALDSFDLDHTPSHSLLLLGLSSCLPGHGLGSNGSVHMPFVQF